MPGICTLPFVVPESFIAFATNMRESIFLYLLFFSCILSCSPGHFSPVQVKSYPYNVEGARHGEQTAMKAFLKPYSDSISGTMNTVIGNLSVRLIKNWPENSLGYLMTDAFLESAREKFGQDVHVAFMNTGGIRLNSLEPGPLTVGKIYELMPFDNLMVLLTVSGTQLQQFMDHMAGRGGWPVSGATYAVQQQKAIQVQIQGEPIAPERKYNILVNDYIANGGDDSNVLKGLRPQHRGYLLRDALIDYIKKYKVIALPPGGNRVKRMDENR